MSLYTLFYYKFENYNKLIVTVFTINIMTTSQ